MKVIFLLINVNYPHDLPSELDTLILAFDTCLTLVLDQFESLSRLQVKHLMNDWNLMSSLPGCSGHQSLIVCITDGKKQNAQVVSLIFIQKITSRD